jgi:concanavalin A-like lectin/glucanase superfamily protein
MSRDFPGTNGNYLEIGDVAAIDITGTALTLAAWVRPDVASGNKWILAKDHNTISISQYRLFIQANKAGITVYDGGSFDSIEGVTSVPTTAWSHLCGVKNGTGVGALKIFLNGLEDGSVTSNRTIQNSTQPLRIGNRGSNDVPFDGQIAECAIWDVPLNAAEIAALAEGVNPLLIRPANLKGYWPLWGTGTPEPDYSGQANFATTTGTVPAGASSPPISPLVLQDNVGRLAAQALTLDAAEVYIDIQALVTAEVPVVYVDLQASGVDEFTLVDAATVYMDITNTGGECFVTSSGMNFGEGDATTEWSSGAYIERWAAEDALRWVVAGISTEPVC